MTGGTDVNVVVPNFFVLGAPKTGTTALAHYVGMRDDAFVTTPKEPFYLAKDFPHLREQHLLETDADYLRLFENGRGALAVGEASTNYMRSKVAVSEALSISPNARFICMLRDPVEIAHAFHMEQLYARNEDEESFEKAWRLQEARGIGDHIPPTCRAPEFLQYREVASIGTQLERVMQQIPAEQLLVLFQSDLAKDTGAVYRQTCSFLGLPDDGRVDFERMNSSHAHRSRLLAAMVLSPPRVIQRPVNRVRQQLRLRKPWPIELVKSWQKVGAERHPLSAEFAAELRSVFASEVALVEQLTARDRSTWLK